MADKRMNELRKEAMERDNHTCCVPDCDYGPKYLNLAHILPEEITKYKYDIDNVVMLCPKHHKLGNFSCHKNPIWFYKFLRENFPVKFVLALKRIQELEDG